MINLEYYRVFYYVATYQSITRAASQLFISQPAVSKAIKKLEEEMNCALFTRTPHGSTLTVEGATLFSHVSKAIKEFEQGEEKISRIDSNQRQIIRVGATESALYSVLISALSQFSSAYPSVRIQINGSSTTDLIDMLEDGTIDVALGVTPLPKNCTLPIIELGEIRDVFFSHKDYSLDDSKPLTPQFLCTLPIVGVGPESSAGRHITAFFKELDLTYSPSFLVETSTNVLPFVENGLAIGLAPQWVIKASSKAKMLRELNTSFSIPARKLFLISNEKGFQTPIYRRFIDFIERQSY